MIQFPLQVGWREWLAFPQLGIPAIKAKVDTGARTSCLHTHSYEEFEKEGNLWIKFAIHPLQKTDKPLIKCESPLVDKRMVMDSGGHKELRPVIKTPIVLAGQQWEIEVTLSNRESMLFRMLLGRTAMVGKITVNPALSYVTGEPTPAMLQNYYPEM
jgi:hypothetical protein